jgi:hypothetical protein
METRPNHRTTATAQSILLLVLEIYLDEPTNEFTQDETVDEIVSVTGD